jgi:hypothetical protein
VSGPILSAARGVAVTLLASACYGFAIGAGKNMTYAWRSAVKFPLLLLGTAALCALAYFVVARFLGVTLPFARVQRCALSAFRAIAVLLCSLSPVAFFLGRTMEAPHERGLGGYPAFVGANMVFVAVAGAVVVVLQARALLRERGVTARQSVAVVCAWLVLSLLVGGQLAFWLRPFFGIASLTGAPPFALGDEPTVTGARNFYEVVWQFVTAADPGDYMRRR